MIRVTGPSLTSAELHVGTEAAGGDAGAQGRSSPTTASTSGSACSGRAAATHDGLRPREVSP